MESNKVGAHTQGKWLINTVQGGRPKVYGENSPFYAIITGVTGEQAQANAQLIAAAPDLLDAITNLRNGLIALANAASTPKRISSDIYNLLLKDNAVNNAIEKATK